MSSEEHKLIYDSLRDLKAHCSCGGFSISAPSFDRDSDDSIRLRAESYHEEHLIRHGVIKRSEAP